MRREIQIVCVLVLVGFGSAASAYVVLPQNVTGGTIPIDRTGGLFNWPASPIDIAGLTDGDTDTGVTLFGLEDVRNRNNALVDTGAFAIFEFYAGQNVESLTFNIAASEFLINTKPPNYHAGSISIGVFDYGDWRASPGLTGLHLDWNADMADGIDWHSITFDANGNSGSSPTTVSDIVNPNGIVRFNVSGPFYEAGVLDFGLEGTPELHIREANVEIIPEPATISLLTLGGLALIRRRKGRARK